MPTTRSKGPRFIAAFILLLVILFFAIEYFIRASQEFSPTSVTNAFLTMMQVIVLILFLVLFFILGRNLVKLYLERKRNIVGSHFKTKLVLFFIAIVKSPRKCVRGVHLLVATSLSSSLLISVCRVA